MDCRKLIAVLYCLSFFGQLWADRTPEQKYSEVQRELARGWNTWDTRSVLTHVYLPYAFAVDINILSADGRYVTRCLIGDRGRDAPVLHPHAHTYDGAYTSLEVTWRGHHFLIETAAEGLSNIIVITPYADNKVGGKLVVVPKALWMRANNIICDSTSFVLQPKDKSVTVKCQILGDGLTKIGKEYIVSLDRPIAVDCGKEKSIGEALRYVRGKGKTFEDENRRIFGKDYDCYNAMQSVLGWDNIYDPGICKVITPVSRIWSSTWFASSDFGGFTLFCWDAYFASMMLSVGTKNLAYANAVEITKAITESGFVPNCYYSNGFKSRDRSQPPVGSMAVWILYQRFGDRWLLELLYDELLTWNRWWLKNRMSNGLLCQGSNPYEKVTYFRSEYDSNCRYGAILESGLDNSPMYDGVSFDTNTHLLRQNDVGTSSLFVMDCDYLAKIAETLGRDTDARQLREDGEKMRQNISLLWNEKLGFYYNRSTVDGKPNFRTSPTCFYPLLAKVPTEKQAKRMIKEHLLNTDEYWGEYVIPSCPRNDPAFKDNDYWRGRIWGPLNFLVYMGLRNYDFPKVRREFAGKSRNLLLKSWLGHGYVFENYNAMTGEGEDALRSDKFYHWGALLGYISLLENKE